MKTTSTHDIILYHIGEVSNAVYGSGMRQTDKDKILKAIDELKKNYNELHIKKEA